MRRTRAILFSRLSDFVFFFFFLFYCKKKAISCLMRETTNRGRLAGRRMARERLVGSNLGCGPVSFVLFVMSDVQGEEEMARYWYREKERLELG